MTGAARLGDKSWFPDLTYDAYLNHAAQSPLSLPVRESIVRMMDEMAATGLSSVTSALANRRRVKEKIGRLLGATPDAIALLPSTTTAITAICLNLHWRKGDRVILFRGEFPGNVTPYQRIAAEKELELVILDLAPWQRDHQEGLALLEEELKQGARLVAVSSVQFQTGLRMPIREICELTHRYGGEVLVDGIQSTGSFPETADIGFDYLASGSHKWLMGPEGAGFVYVKPEKIQQFSKITAGWQSHENFILFLTAGPGHLDYDADLRDTVDFLEPGTPNTIGYCGLEAGLDALLMIGTDRIFDHLQRYHDAIEAPLTELGLQSQRASFAAGRSGILSFLPPAGVDVVALSRALGDLGIATGTPDGHLRLSPHWPNDPVQEAPLVIKATQEVLRRLL